ncbi:hypothetical protein CL616_01265 [archaeon]|nr:hypothetical protein [archaeon]
MNKAEEEFQKYLNKHNIPFCFIDQETNTFSKTVKRLDLKRPDFFVLVPNFGFVLVDIKDKVPLKKHGKICLDYFETLRYCRLQKLFNMPVWFVVSNERVHYSTWFCMSATRARDLDEFLVGREYLSLPIDEYFQLSTNEGFYKIFTKSNLL